MSSSNDSSVKKRSSIPPSRPLSENPPSPSESEPEVYYVRVSRPSSIPRIPIHPVQPASGTFPCSEDVQKIQDTCSEIIKITDGVLRRKRKV